MFGFIQILMKKTAMGKSSHQNILQKQILVFNTYRKYNDPLLCGTQKVRSVNDKIIGLKPRACDQKRRSSSEMLLTGNIA